MNTIKHHFLSFYSNFSRIAGTSPLRLFAVMAMLLNLLLEICGRRSVIDGIAFLFFHPYIFCLNALIIFLTLCVSLLFRRRSFVLTATAVGWAVLGIANCVILGMRNTPLAAIDFGLVLSCMSIITIYLNVFEILLICAAFVLVVIGLVKLWRVTECLSAPMFSRMRGGAMLAVCGMVSGGVMLLSVRAGAVETDFADLPGAYDDYGFAYCFSLSVIDRGVDEPDDYADGGIDGILTELGGETAPHPETTVSGDSTAAETETSDPNAVTAADRETPNIIFVQLESFFDVNRLSGITFSENPVPVFTALKEQYSTGYLTVPSIGAGTVNTEFEILTGMNLDDFGAGEYPYKTVLRRQTAESAAYNLRGIGYTAHAIHNNTATFYERNRVYSSLGFDTFTPLEYMKNVTYNPLGWAKDAALTGAIGDCLASTEGADFVFAVSVQPHGRYPDEETAAENDDAYDTASFLDRLFGEDADEEEENGAGGNLTGNVTVTLTEEELASQRIDVYGIEDESLSAQYRYYVNQLYETDAFLGALIAVLTETDEETVVVFYGDHLPCFDYTAEDMADGTTPFETEYVIWSNFELEKQDRDLYAYQLMADVLDRLDIHEGIITRLHQTYLDNGDRSTDDDPSTDDYLSSLELLEYDMLYGNKEVWGGINPLLPTVLQMGINEIRVIGVRSVGTSLYVTGENFTPFSCVLIGGETCETVWIDENTLYVPDAEVFQGERISVAQRSADGTVLGESGAVFVGG